MVWIKMPLNASLWRGSRHVQLAGHCWADPAHKGRLRSSTRSWRSCWATTWSETAEEQEDAESWSSLNGDLRQNHVRTLVEFNWITD